MERLAAEHTDDRQAVLQRLPTCVRRLKEWRFLRLAPQCFGFTSIFANIPNWVRLMNTSKGDMCQSISQAVHVFKSLEVCEARGLHLGQWQLCITVIVSHSCLQNSQPLLVEPV